MWHLETPPPPLTPAEFFRRWDAGARTFAEIHPEWLAWQARMRARAWWAWFWAVWLPLAACGVMGLWLLIARGRGR